jgi:hypothetical protein
LSKQNIEPETRQVCKQARKSSNLGKGEQESNSKNKKRSHSAKSPFSPSSTISLFFPRQAQQARPSQHSGGGIIPP